MPREVEHHGLEVFDDLLAPRLRLVEDGKDVSDERAEGETRVGGLAAARRDTGRSADLAHLRHAQRQEFYRLRELLLLYGHVGGACNFHRRYHD